MQTFWQHAAAPASCKAPAPARLSGLMHVVRLAEACCRPNKAAWIPTSRREGRPRRTMAPPICCGVMRLACVPHACLTTPGIDALAMHE